MNSKEPKKLNLFLETETSISNIEKAISNPDQASSIVRAGRLIVALLAIGVALYVIKSAALGGLPSWQHRAFFTSVALVLCFIYVPYKKGNKKLHWLFDFVPMILSLATMVFSLTAFPEVSLRQGNAANIDITIGTIMILLIIEGVRRTIGPAMAIMVITFWAYIFVGPWFPGLLGHPGFSYSKMIDTMFITTNGIFTSPIYIASTVLILFLIFCSLLLKTGAGQLFVELAFAITGKRRGGPALAAVLASALMATITGNGAANATMTGSFTIPLMKKVGYRKEFAGAVEAVASQGGQIMPPIMGAAAFIMAEYTGIPFIKIAGYALIPAILYFLVVAIVIYLQAVKQGLEGLPEEQLPNFWDVLRKRGYLLLPLIVIVGMMIKGYSPMMAGLWAIVVVFVLSLLKKSTRMSLLQTLAALEDGVRSSLSTVMACAGAGIITGSVIMTGLGIRFSRMAIELSGGELLPMLFMIMIASIILGMGMPTVSAYVILATVAVGALVKMDVPVIAAHFFVFYFGIFSGITPPVAITSYITAGIAGGDPLKTAWTSLRIGLAGFILPFMMIYNPSLILEGSTIAIIFSTVTAAIGLVSFASFIQGYLITVTSAWQRLALLLSAGSLVNQGLTTDIIGFSLLGIVIIVQWRNSKKDQDFSLPFR
ncbi:MAG: TRAP transporter permease [Bacillota bacterium]|nr:TRAP transporter permease [Bacillota bacterium]